MSKFSDNLCVECDPNAVAEEDDSDAENDIRPVDRIIVPSDVATFTNEDESIFILGTNHCKVTVIQGYDDSILIFFIRSNM